MSNNKKIGVMTWHTYENYGSALQAGALSHVLRRLGYCPEFIQYTPKGTLRDVREITFLDVLKGIKNRRKVIRNLPYISEKVSSLYSEFLSKRLDYSECCNSYVELVALNKQYSAFVTGSDQIWSPLCYDSKYFLDFVENTNKMIAYAPSIGSTEIVNPIIRERMADNISRFKYLSVREKQGAKLIKELTGQEAKVVLDPTLLLEPEEWDSYIDTESVQIIPDKDYIICYFLGDSKKYTGYVRALAETMKVPFYVIPVTTSQKNSAEAVPFEVGPREFVSLIKNAKHVVTDSLHGTLFSINYNVEFTVFKRFKDNESKNQNSRIYNILQLVGLENRLKDFEKLSGVKEGLPCDFSDVNNRLKILREESIHYLESCLKESVCNENSLENKVDLDYEITGMCCGCGACASVCPNKAIKIEKNSDGFEHYIIDHEKCVGCGMCKAVCPMYSVDAPYMKESKDLYSIKSNTEQVLKVSSSGGVGHEIASMLLDDDYAVCGCIYDAENNIAKHIWVTSNEKDKLALLQGSKYIQSVSSNALEQLQEIVKTRKVAFFGTPCQAAAVDKMLRKIGKRDKAVIVDLICHGVPSIHLWNKYLSDIDRKNNIGEHPVVIFRNKDRDWRNRSINIRGNACKYENSEDKDDFYAFFRRGLCYMESCTECPYRERSAADLRIGDYWGDKFISDKQGVSMVITNTECGKQIVKALEDRRLCNVKQEDLSEYWSVQYPYNPQRPLIREQLIEELKDKKSDLHKLRRKYCIYYDRVEMITKRFQILKRLLKRG